MGTIVRCIVESIPLIRRSRDCTGQEIKLRQRNTNPLIVNKVNAVHVLSGLLLSYQGLRGKNPHESASFDSVNV